MHIYSLVIILNLTAAYFNQRPYGTQDIQKGSKMKIHIYVGLIRSQTYYVEVTDRKRLRNTILEYP